jgi:cell division protein FtsN
MNRLISILITLFVIFLIYIWINSVMSKKSSPDIQSDRQTQTDVQKESTEKEGDKSLKLSNYEDQKRTEQSAQAIKGTEETSGEKASDSIKEQTTEESNPAPIAIPVNQKPAQKPVQKPAPPKKVGNAANMHLVITGNFLKRSNAESRLNELLQNGYKNAEIVNFDLSEYYTVIAGRFDDVIEARRIAKKVNDYLNIKAYVRVGKN